MMTIVSRYIGSATYARSNYGTTSSRVWLYRLICQGNERNIAHCQHNGWGVITSSSCNSRRADTVVSCLRGMRSPNRIPVFLFLYEGNCVKFAAFSGNYTKRMPSNLLMCKRSHMFFPYLIEVDFIPN